MGEETHLRAGIMLRRALPAKPHSGDLTNSGKPDRHSRAPGSLSTSTTPRKGRLPPLTGHLDQEVAMSRMQEQRRLRSSAFFCVPRSEDHRSILEHRGARPLNRPRCSRVALQVQTCGDQTTLNRSHERTAPPIGPTPPPTPPATAPTPLHGTPPHHGPQSSRTQPPMTPPEPHSRSILTFPVVVAAATSSVGASVEALARGHDRLGGRRAHR